MKNHDMNNLKHMLVSLIEDFGPEEGEKKFLEGLPALDPAVIAVRRRILSTLVQDENGEFYFDER